MTSMLNEPVALNILIEARLEQLRGGRVQPRGAAACRGGTEKTLEDPAEMGRRAGADHGFAGLAAANRITVGIESTS